MSAYIVHPDTIDLLSEAARAWAVNVRTDDHGILAGRTAYRRMGEILWAENHRSVNFRYDESAVVPPYTHTPISLELAAVAIRPEVMVLGVIACLRYQSCEHPDYARSLAARILDAIERAAIHRLTGTDNAPWEYTREWSREREAAIKDGICHAADCLGGCNATEAN